MHIPVMLKETIEALNIVSNGSYLDLTTGFGGHSSEILKQLSNGSLVCVDRDIEALNYTKNRLKDIVNGNRVEYFQSNYSRLDLVKERFGTFDGVIADLGVSSYQLDQKERGFSYRYDYQLDMRMDRSSEKKAIDLFELDENDIADVLYYFGEITSSRRLAQALKTSYSRGDLHTTFDLKRVIDNTFKNASNRLYSQVFQAIRIWTNDELKSLEEMLMRLKDLLNIGGRAVILTYHSLEDRIVKKAFNDGISRFLEDGYKDYDFKPYYKKVKGVKLKPSKEEIATNVRARSAKLRVVERV